MRIVLEGRKCAKELHEFLYERLTIKCFNMFYCKSKLHTRLYNTSVYIPDGCKERSARER